VRLPAQSPDRATNDHIFHLIFPSEEARDACQGALRREGIGATFHYVPLHSSPFGRRLPGTRGAFPVSERIAGGLLRLPMHPLLEDADVDRVIEAVTARPA
jgi:dTDP-4-amino-4,6-dideoxygalactose transaminase